MQVSLAEIKLEERKYSEEGKKRKTGSRCTYPNNHVEAIRRQLTLLPRG